MGTILVIIGCILCACYLQQSISKIRRMEFDKELQEYKQVIAKMEDQGLGVSQAELADFKEGVNASLQESARASQ